MNRSHRDHAGDAVPSDGDLKRLLDVEERIEERLQLARRRATEIVERARRAVVRAEALVAEDAERQFAELCGHLNEEQRRQAEQIAEAAAQQAKAIDELPDKRIHALVDYVIEQVLR